MLKTSKLGNQYPANEIDKLDVKHHKMLQNMKRNLRTVQQLTYSQATCIISNFTAFMAWYCLKIDVSYFVITK